MNSDDYRSNHALLLAAINGDLNREHAKRSRRPAHPYTMHMSRLDRAAAVGEICELKGGLSAITERWARDSLKTFIACLEVDAFAQEHAITQARAEAAREAAWILGVPLEEYDPHSANAKIHRLCSHMQYRYIELIRFRSPRASKVLEVIRRRVTRTAAFDRERIILLSLFAAFVLAETTPRMTANHRPRHEEDREIIDAKRDACEFIKLAGLGGISDSAPYKTVCLAFGVTRKTIERWISQHEVGDRYTRAERIQMLAPDPLTRLLRAGGVYLSRGTKSQQFLRDSLSR